MWTGVDILRSCLTMLTNCDLLFTGQRGTNLGLLLTKLTKYDQLGTEGTN
jgi:hypothetical protein